MISASQFRPLALIATLLWAALRNRQRGRLSLYLWTELCTTVVIEAMLVGRSPSDRAYALTYDAMRILDLSAALYLGRPQFAAWFAAGAMALTVLVSTHLTLSTGMVLVEGFFFAAAGAGLAIRNGRPTRAYIAILWLLWALFDFALALKVDAMLPLNGWWPSAAAIAAFLVVGVWREHPTGEVLQSRGV